MAPPRVSVCLPTWNGARDLRRLLPALLAQQGVGDLEILAVDSSSTDDSVELLRAAGAKVEVRPKDEFRHGPTRNRLASMARGEVCVFLSQDALPASDDFLTLLLAPLEDGAVAGSTARVLPHPSDDPLTARTVLEAPEAQAKSMRCALEQGQVLASLPRPDREDLLRFNDVASAVRREVLAAIPFPDLPFGEDSAWAARALEEGHALVFAADAVVLHAHRYGPRTAFERYRVDAAFQRLVHGIQVRPRLVSVLRGWLFEMRADVKHVLLCRTGWLHLLRAPFLRGGQVLGQWFGTRGWNLPGSKDSATRRLS